MPTNMSTTVAFKTSLVCCIFPQEKFILALKTKLCGFITAFGDMASHCSYLDIYISQKIRLFVVDLEEVKFQTNLQAKLINFLVWKFKSIIWIFLLFFAEFVKSTAFYTLLLLFQRVDELELRFDAKIAIPTCQLFGIAVTVCKKQWIWQILQKIEEKLVK